SAREDRSGVQAQVTVQPAHGLTREEVDQLVEESIEHAREDFTARRLVELRNKAEADLRHTDKALAQAGSALTAEQRARIDQTAAALRAAVAGAGLADLQRAIDEFGAATNPLAHLLMNEVLRKALGGGTEEGLDPTKL